MAISMNGKVIAIGIAAVVILAGAGCGFAIMNKTSDGGENAGLPDVTGKWDLAYIEIAKLADSNDKPYLDGNDVDITYHLLNPSDNHLSVEVTRLGEHGFEGKFIGKNVKTDIHGTYNGTLKFRIVAGDSTYLFEGSAKSAKGYGDYLSASFIKYKAVDGVSTICAVSYLFFVHEGSSPIPVRSDFFDMKLMDAGYEAQSIIHTPEDFVSGNGAGKKISVGLDFIKANNMISIFNVNGGGDSNVNGVQAVVSMGISPGGIVFGNIMGNLSNDNGATNWVFIGNMGISKGKAVFMQHLHTGEFKTTYVETEYNVPYYHGKDLPVAMLAKEYKGTLVIKGQDGQSSTRETTKSLTIFDNTIYRAADKGYVWFGEVHGSILDISLLNSETRQVGRLTGHIEKDGSIHLFGMVRDIITNEVEFLSYDLEPVKG